MKTTRTWIGSVVLAASITACGSSQEKTVVVKRSAQTAPVAREPVRHDHDDMCMLMKMDAATTQVTATETDDGVAIVFTSSGDLDDLRARVRRIADMHDRMSMKRIPSHATVEDLDDGVRIVLVPIDPVQLEPLREQARVHAAMMARGECPMKGQMAEQPIEVEPSGT